jgi:hypothetical protein
VRGRTLLLAVALLLVAALPGQSTAEVVQRGKLRVAFQAKLTPRALPRSGSAPVGVTLGGRIASTDGGTPPQLRRISIAINSYGRLATGSLPVCRVEQIQPATTEGALEACGRSLVGTGSFSAKVLLPEQAPFPSAGRVYAYNGTYRGKPAILAHVYGTQPAPSSYTLPFVVSRTGGTFGTLLSASLPQVTSEWGYITGIGLELDRIPVGRGRGYVSASCPAPAGFSLATFTLARSTFSFAGGTSVGANLQRTCRVGG